MTAAALADESVSLGTLVATLLDVERCLTPVERDRLQGLANMAIGVSASGASYLDCMAVLMAALDVAQALHAGRVDGGQEVMIAVAADAWRLSPNEIRERVAHVRLVAATSRAGNMGTT